MTPKQEHKLDEVHAMLTRLVARQDLQENELRRHAASIADHERRIVRGEGDSE
jgi:hypothetical protein